MRAAIAFATDVGFLVLCSLTAAGKARLAPGEPAGKEPMCGMVPFQVIVQGGPLGEALVTIL